MPGNSAEEQVAACYLGSGATNVSKINKFKSFRIENPKKFINNKNSIKDKKIIENKKMNINLLGPGHRKPKPNTAKR